ncbi:MAG: hypothetical protein JO036_18200 [Candidatus Eremiobacteraeota bacterium]|nr:hypothetical protein [Candidatus Eremiobacteraeota bacterium]
MSSVIAALAPLALLATSPSPPAKTTGATVTATTGGAGVDDAIPPLGL